MFKSTIVSFSILLVFSIANIFAAEIAIPGAFSSLDFSSRSMIMETYNRGGDSWVTKIPKNEQLNFELNAEETRYYKLKLFYSSQGNSGQVRVSAGSNSITETIPQTSSATNYQTHYLTEEILLTQGTNSFHLKSLAKNLHLVSIRLEAGEDYTETTPVQLVPGKINVDESDGPFSGQAIVTLNQGEELKYRIQSTSEKSSLVKLYYISKNNDASITATTSINSISAQYPKVSDYTVGYSETVLGLAAGEDELVIRSESDGLKIKAIRLEQSDLPPTNNAPVQVTPGKINIAESTGALAGNSIITLNSGESVSYNIGTEVESPISVKYYYISNSSTAQIKASVAGETITTTLPKATNYSVKYSDDILVLPAGQKVFTLTALNDGIKLKGLRLELSQPEEAPDPVNSINYKINIGGSNTGEFVSDKNLERKWTELPKFNQAFTVFGLKEDAKNNYPSVTKSGTTLSSTPVEVFQTTRTDTLDQNHHAPGLVYRFRVAAGTYKLRVHTVTLSNQRKIRVSDDSELIDTIITTPSNASRKGYTHQLEIEVPTGLDELNLSFYPEFPEREIELAALELVSLTEDQGIDLGWENTSNIRYIAPSEKGNGSGMSWDNAASFNKINSKIGALSETGGYIILSADDGEYERSSEHLIKKGASYSNLPITIIGMSANGKLKPAVITGTRNWPWPTNPDNTNNIGKECFRIVDGAKNLIFKNMKFKNFGNGIFRFAGETSNIRIEDMQAENFGRFIENLHSSGSASSPTANWNKLVVKFLHMEGYDSSVIKMSGGSKDLLARHIFGDSQAQQTKDKTDFSVGIGLYGNSKDVMIRQATLLNHQQLRRASNKYWNGDSVSSENSTSNVTIMETIGAGNTDSAFDTKTVGINYIRTTAIDNKRNYRVWRESHFDQIYSIEPVNHGGTGGRTHLGSYDPDQPYRKLYLTNGIFVDQYSNPNIFEMNAPTDFYISDTKVYSEDKSEAESETLGESSIHIGDNVQFLDR